MERKCPQETVVAQRCKAGRLKQIADYIPNYSWGYAEGVPSGANTNDILVGLKNLGYTKATLEPYDFDMLYKNGGTNMTIACI